MGAATRRYAACDAGRVRGLRGRVRGGVPGVAGMGRRHPGRRDAGRPDPGQRVADRWRRVAVVASPAEAAPHAPLLAPARPGPVRVLALACACASRAGGAYAVRDPRSRGTTPTPSARCLISHPQTHPPHPAAGPLVQTRIGETGRARWSPGGGTKLPPPRVVRSNYFHPLRAYPQQITPTPSGAVSTPQRLIECYIACTLLVTPSIRCLRHNIFRPSILFLLCVSSLSLRQ